MKNSPDQILVSTQLLAEYIKVERNYISQLVNGYGAPEPVAHGQYDLKAFVGWFVDHLRKEKKNKKLEDNDPQKRYINAKAEETEMKNAVTRKELIPADQVRYTYGALAALFTKRIEALPGILAPVLVGATKDNITEIIRKEIESIQTQIANESKDKFPEPAPDVSGNTEADA
jgi:phage terminase Nu1 subunit (DNA packaging protein)